MFVVLNMIKPCDGFFARAKQRKEIAHAQARTCRNEKGLPFFILNVYEAKSGINWALTAQKCGRYASRVIAPRSLTLPDSSAIKRFVPSFMNSLLIFNTAAEIISMAKLPPEKICITLTDRTALHASRICRLLPLAACVRVVTAQPERYAAACSCAMTEYGASLVIRPSYEPSLKPDIVICCDGAVTCAMSNAAIFTSKRINCGKIRFSGSGTLLTAKHTELIPPSIDTVDFAGALTELCGSSEYKSSVFSELDISCSACAVGQPEKCLECYFKNSVPKAAVSIKA